MIDYNIIKDKSIALLIWNTRKENDAHVYLGKIITKNEQYFFMNEEKKWKVSISDEQYNKLLKVDEDMKEVFLNADYFMFLSMANLPDDSTEGYSIAVPKVTTELTYQIIRLS